MDYIKKTQIYVNSGSALLETPDADVKLRIHTLETPDADVKLQICTLETPDTDVKLQIHTLETLAPKLQTPDPNL